MTAAAPLTTPYTTLIDVPQLQALQASDQPLMVFDCSFELADPARGYAQYCEAHLPAARYVHLDTDLSAQHGGPSASGGRHPLPTREAFAHWLTRIGFGNAMQAVVYDRSGASQCARLWWMLKWLGHDAVAVLDGGLSAWQAAHAACESGPTPDLATLESQPHRPAPFALHAPLRQLVSVDEVLEHLHDGSQTIVDARAEPRFRGEVEPLDPVAGHIPGALNRPFGLNLQNDGPFAGHFKPAAQLRAEFLALLGQRPPASVVHQCGSGVSALPNLLAMEVAGLGSTALFAGSWSQWCADPSRPVARGA